ncbi:MAG: PAS domain S-box protein, partial [Methanoregula sp.]|nr:PAS domain S-box protein [Methanoregula sp.]
MAAIIRVLYVDDEPGLLELGKVFLEMSGTLRIDTALSAADAIKKIVNEAYEGIISDYQMPVMDGIAFLKILRKDNNGIPFILFTGRGREEVVIEALNSGADFYLQKGGDPMSQFVELEHKILLAIERKQTGAALIESRQRMTDIIDHLPDATFAIDLDGKVIAWNRAMEEMTGVHKEQILGTGDHSYALPFYGTRRPILLDLVLREDMETEKIYPNIIKKDNKRISEIHMPLLYGGKGAYLWCIASPLYDTHGNITGAIESLRDITDQKRQDHILITQLNLGLALQSIRGLNTTLKTCLHAAIEISGMDAGGIYLVDDISGSVDLILSQNLDDEFVKSVSHYPAGSANAQMVMAGKPIYTHFNKTGIAYISGQEREKLRAVAIIPVVSMGRVIACINIFSHIFDGIPSSARVGLETIAIQIGTAIERIHTDEALARSEQKYRNVVEDQTEFICRFLPDGTHVFVNEAYCRYFSKTCREIIGTRFISQVVDEDKQRVQQHFRQLTRQNPVATIEHRIIMPDGTVRWQQWSDRAIFNERGMLVEYQSVGRDITERVKIEVELKKFNEDLERKVIARTSELSDINQRLIIEMDIRRTAEKHLRESLDEKVVLLREIHHRVRNNLQIIISLLSLQKQRITDERSLQSLFDSECRIRSMALVQEKLHLSDNLAIINFGDCIKTMSLQLMSLYSINQSQIKFTIELNDIFFDIDHAVPIGLLMNELISNALKHAFPDGQKGDITIKGESRDSEVVITVMDNGIGIPLNFDWQNTPTLGLHLVLALIDQVKGTIELVRQCSTTFIIRIP